MTYLRNGAEAFMGHTTITYSYVFSAEIAWCLPWPLDDVCGTRQTVEDWPVDQGSQAIEWFAFSEIVDCYEDLSSFLIVGGGGILSERDFRTLRQITKIQANVLMESVRQ